MKHLIPFILILFSISCTTEPTVTIKGHFSLIDGKPVTNGKIIYKRTSKIVDDLKNKINITGTNEFEINLTIRDEYVFTFAHQGYASQMLFLDCYLEDLYEFNVTLDHYSMPDTTQIGIVTEIDGLDISKSKPMTRNGDTWTIDIPTDKTSLKYQIYIGHRTINGEDKIVDCDDSGDFISEVNVTNGIAHIEYTLQPEYFTGNPMYYGFTNVLNTSFPIGEMKFRYLYPKWVPKLKEKAAAVDTTLDGLEPLMDELRTIIGTSDNQSDSLYFYYIFNRYFWSWTDEFDRNQDILEKKDDLEFMAYLPMPGIINYIMKLYPFTEDGDSTDIRQKHETFFTNLLESDISPAKKISILYNVASYYRYTNKNKSKQDYWGKWLIEDYPDSYMAKNIKEQMDMDSMLGHPAPDFTLPDRYGNEASLSSYRKKLVLLDFWGRSCGPCVAEIPNMKATYAELDTSKIEFISICIDMFENELRTYTEEREMSWVHLYAPGYETDVAKSYHLSFVPHLLLIDSNGIIVEMDTGLRGDKLGQTIEKYLK